MAKSHIVFVCTAAAALLIVLRVGAAGDDAFALGTPSEGPLSSPFIELDETPAKVDLYGLIERPADAGYWYLVRSNGACNSYSTAFDAQSLSRNWQTKSVPPQSRVAY